MPRPKRGRKRAPEDTVGPAIEQGDNATQPVLGGMRGGYRISGDAFNDADEISGEGATTEMGVSSFRVTQDDKAIVCQQWSGPPEKEHRTGRVKPLTPKLIFTHGAGGGLANPATVQFAAGFTGEAPPVVCFQGTMNLQSRVRSFKAVVSQLAESEHASRDTFPALGGRSMGARAAVMAANGDEEGRFKTLVLVSYPLLGGKQGADVRDQILYDISADTDVLFVTGSSDKMCPVERLRDVRKNMKAKSWLLEVEGADHGMSAKPKQATAPLRKKTGEIAALWTTGHHHRLIECKLSWDAATGTALVSDWASDEADNAAPGGATQTEDAGRKRKAPTFPATQPNKRQQRKSPQAIDSR